MVQISGEEQPATTEESGGALAAVEQPSAQSASPSNSGDTLGSFREAMAGAAKELGIPEEYAGKLMNMLGIGNAVQLIEMLQPILQKFAENGAHGVGGEMGNPQANLQPPAAGAAIQEPEVQVG